MTQGAEVVLQSILRTTMQPLIKLRDYSSLPPEAKAAELRDHFGLPSKDPGSNQVVEEAVAWLYRAQDHSTSCDGGVAHSYSLLNGWSSSYPETTGYIVPTLLHYSELHPDGKAHQRAARMLDWLISIQLPDGSFQGGRIDTEPVVPVTFNTGQILMGLAAGARALGRKYHEPMCRAADWLVQTQDPDGCWRRHPSPLARPGERVYDTHVAFGLLEAARVEPRRSYVEAALANVRWALRFQSENGWFDKCCLTDTSQPLTHTLGYALRGVLEAYRFTKDRALLQAGRRTADGLLSAVRSNGFLPGQLDRNWKGTVKWACLTGTVQVAYCWLLLYEDTGDEQYRSAAFVANRYVRRTVAVKGPGEIRGGVKGCFPVYGDYLPYKYANWACKFMIDSNLLEIAVRERQVVSGLQRLSPVQLPELGLQVHD
jgi:hypothetical protein